ncbi:MAG: lytic transglycosylase domain-containing protein [Bacillota bacterium]
MARQVTAGALICLFLLFTVGFTLLQPGEPEKEQGQSLEPPGEEKPFDLEATIIRQAAKYPQLTPELLHEVIRFESNFDPMAVSHKGAMGLGQIMPGTGAWAAERLGVKDFNPEMLFDPEFNIKLTAYILSYLIQRYHGDLDKALTAYNRGERGLAQFVARTGTPKSYYSKQILKQLKE